MSLIETKTLQELITLQLEKWQELEPNININSDSMVYMDAAVIADVLYQLQQDAISLVNNAFIAYATGDELTNLGADRGIERITAVKASGILKFYRGAKASVNYIIPSGTEVSTQQAGDGTTINFKTIEEKTLYGSISVPANLVASGINSGGALIDSTQYHYKITAKDGDRVETSASTVSTATTPVSSDQNSVSLVWDAVPRAISYNIYVASGIGQEDSVQYLDNSINPYYTDILGTALNSNIPPSTNETGALQVFANAEASIAGDDANVGAGTITRFVSQPTGIDYVINPSGFDSGVDEESDTTYRARLKVQLQTNTGKTTITGYQNTALTVAGVQTATVYQPYPGTNDRNIIWVYITSNSGTGIPSASLIADVQAELDKDENRALCDSITVKAPSTVVVNVSAEITAYTAGSDEAQVRTNVQSNIEGYFPTISVGDTVKVKEIESIVYNTEGVSDFVLTIPSGNITLSSDEMAIAGSITIT